MDEAKREIEYLRGVLDRKPYKCDRCGEGSRNNHLFAPPIQMFGGICAALCLECHSAWNAYIAEQELWLRVRTHDTKIKLLQGADGAYLEKAEELAREKIDLEREAFAISQKWRKGEI